MSQFSRLSTKEQGTVEVILLGFSQHQLPRMLDIQDKVNGGDVLDEYDIIFLEQTLAEIQSVAHFADTHPEFQTLVAEVAELYERITLKATTHTAQKGTL
ncbi:hypothetical protein [Marinagarivorans algicola]|uniref:hypothetical protein n=1 Tax=Marinagarivorans algicola TaxID=1513270 RepID=UPI0006B57D1C|nr:hypothetical protein [Marinagarivorans algicola]